MKKLIALLLGLCMVLGTAAGLAEETAPDCTGTWYLVYANVSIGEFVLDGDGSYRLVIYSQEGEGAGTWTMENGVVTLTAPGEDPTSYVYDETRLLPIGFVIDYTIRREAGRITDAQLDAYIQEQTIPDGMTGEEMQEIIQGIYDAVEQEEQREDFGEFSGVWVNDAGGYLTIWGKDITAAFPIDGELATGFYGSPGEWSFQGNALANSDGTIIMLRNDGSILCYEESGTYSFRKVFSPVEVLANPDAEAFAGSWNGIGILVTDPSGVVIFTPIAGYDLVISADTVRTLFEGEVNEYRYEMIPERGALAFGAEEATDELILYQDMTLRWVLSDTIVLIMVKADQEGNAIPETGTEPENEPAGGEEPETPETVTEPENEPAGGEEPETPETVTEQENEPAGGEEPETPETVTEPEGTEEPEAPAAAAPAVIRKMTVEPGEIVLYIGSDDSATVHVVTEPETVPEGLTWIMRPDSITEVIPGENGTAVVKPLVTGAGTLSVREPGGKSAMLKVSVLKPVESVELTTKNRAVPGKIMWVSAKILPGDAGNKKVEWSLDVGEDVATINNRGKIRISQKAVPGTVFTVTCTAAGAKEPVVQTIQIEIVEK